MLPSGLANISRLRHSRSLFLLFIASLVAAMVLVPIWLLDARELNGVPVWEKPLKFYVSAAIFAITYSWLSSFITRGTRLVSRMGAVIAVSLAIELILITAVAALGETSHFNVSSPLAIAIWSLMATFISIVLIATVVLSILILSDHKQQSLLRVGLGLGSLNTAVGMGLAFLMTSPTADQLSNFQGIAGAHSVGVSDGGPGLPLLGWSTVAGDLRVGHFFGLHSIQVAIVLMAISLVLPVALRAPLVVVGNISYLGFVILITVQALRAEPFSNPSDATIGSFSVLLVIATIAFVSWVLAIGRKEKTLLR